MIIQILIITFVLAFVYFTYGRRDARKIIKEEVNDAINFKYKPKKKLTEDRILLEAPKGQSNANDTCNFSNNHFIIYGGSGTGKSYWLKKNYLEKFNISKYFVYSPHQEEWGKNRILIDLKEIQHINNATIVLDDVENKIKNSNVVNDLFLNGRHRNIQCIIIAHTTKIISNQIRQNINNILITTNNTPEFYRQLKEVYGINESIEDINLEYGMILYEIPKRKITIADKDGQIIRNNNEEYNINKYKNVYNFTDEEKEEIKEHIELTSIDPVDIPLHLVPYYKVKYFLSKGVEQNIMKMKKVYSGNQNFSDISSFVDQTPKYLNKLDKTITTSRNIYNNAKFS